MKLYSGGGVFERRETLRESREESEDGVRLRSDEN